MKIVFLIHTLAVAGAEKHLLSLLPRLKEYGIDSELICVTSCASAPGLEKFLHKFEDAGIKTTVYTWKYKTAFWSIAKKIARYLKANKLHVLHAHLFNADLIASLVKTFFYKDIMLISTKHGYREAYQLKTALEKKSWKYTPYYFLSKWIFNKTDTNIAVSHAIANLFSDLRISPQKMRVIHHGVEIPLVAHTVATLPESPKILSVGRLVPIKGYSYLIEAMPLIIEQFPDVTLIILGEGPEKDKLISMAGQHGVLNHIEFAGFAAPADYAGQCDVMAIPAVFEAFGLVYIEAFALKIPVVAFDSGAAREIIDDNITGLLAQKMDSRSLAEKIISLLTDTSAKEAIARSAFQKFISYYTINRMAKETCAFYFSLLKEK